MESLKYWSGTVFYFIVGLVYSAAWIVALWQSYDLILTGFQVIGIFIVARFIVRYLYRSIKQHRKFHRKSGVLERIDARLAEIRRTARGQENLESPRTD